jgi:hypothetical protein
MSDKMRWRYGDTNPVVVPVGSGTFIELGDMVYLDHRVAKPVGSATMKAKKLKKRFLGVAMQRSAVGDTNPIRVATTGVFEFDTLLPSYHLLGDPVGILGNQMVIGMKRKNAVGRIAKTPGINSSELLVDIRSTIMTGGV